MAKPSNTKIEQRALNALESIIDEHLTMSYQFNSQDKEMSWDGYIDIFKINNGDQSKANFDDRVPVQIKGHIDEKQRYIKKNRINYEVSLDDLRVYSKEKGVLYFQIFLCKEQREVFYTILYPSKILDYLDKAEKRHNQKSINIPFSKLKRDPDTLYNVAKQFSNEGTKQGSAFTPLVQDRIKKDEFDNIEYVKFSAVGATTLYEALQRLSSGDVCFYGKTNDDKYERPIEWQDNSVFYVDNEVNQDVAVEDRVYYQKYKCLTGSNGEMVITLSPNLKYNISGRKMEFTPVSTLDKLYNDSVFLLHLTGRKEFSVAGHEINITDTLSKDFEDRLRFYVELYEILDSIAFELSIPWSQLAEDHIKSIKEIIGIRQNCIDNHLADGFYKHLWSFDGKDVPIIIKKDGDAIELSNAVYTDKIAIFLPDDDVDGLGYRMPLFASLDAKILSNLYYYDHDSLRKQIDTCDINEKTNPALNDCALVLINVFDLNGNHHFLDLADYLLQKLNYPENKILALINKLQIKKRRGSLNRDDIILLDRIDDSDVQILFGKYVLLEDKAKASKMFNQFTDEEREFYSRTPIYKLYSDLQ